jgi:hypothetical protein
LLPIDGKYPNAGNNNPKTPKKIGPKITIPNKNKINFKN